MHIFLLVFTFLLLLFHIYMCKNYYKNFFGPFQIYGIITLTLICLVQIPIIEYYPISGKTIAIFLASYFLFFVFTLDSCKSMWINLRQQLESVNFHFLKKAWFVCTGIFGLATIAQWLIAIKYFGSISYMFQHAMASRVSVMENSIFPVYITYTGCVGYIASGVGGFLLFFLEDKITHKIRYIIPLLISIIASLIDFSRMGMLFHMLMYIAAFFIHYNGLDSNLLDLTDIKEKKRKIKKYCFVFFILALCVLILPKYFRDSGGNYIDPVLQQYTKLDTSNIVIRYGLHLYEYIASPIIAVGEYLKDASNNHTYGMAFFRPILHLLGRIFNIQYTDYELIYENISTPINTNVFTYIREAYSDFGYFGVFLVPLLWGMLTSFCLKVKIKNMYLKVLIIQWVYVYILFGFFYTPFSQGGISFGFFLYFLFVTIFRNKIQNC